MICEGMLVCLSLVGVSQVPWEDGFVLPCHWEKMNLSTWYPKDFEKKKNNQNTQNKKYKNKYIKTKQVYIKKIVGVGHYASGEVVVCFCFR